MSVCRPKDVILAMSLDTGGHLTHGSKVNFSGKIYNFVFYGVDENGFIDYEDIRRKLINYDPRLIVVGASAYSREIDFKKIYEIINEVYLDSPHPYYMVDMAHIAGLVAAGCHQSPFGYADIITTTTHKTLRNMRGGLIFCKKELKNKVDSAVFPGSQGGSLMNMIAAKTVGAFECLQPDYKDYIYKVVSNTAAMCDEFLKMGYKVVTGGTDNHLFLLDLSDLGISGRQLQDACDRNGITLNKNCIPGETKGPFETSGVRIGCAAETTRGKTEEDFREIAHRIDEIIKNLKN